MIEITNGIDTFVIPKGAMEIYKNQGFKAVKKVVKQERKTGNENTTTGNETNDFVNEMVEKPMGEWKSADVKKFAEIMGIDLKGTESLTQAKQRVKNFIDTEM